ncbi:MAG: type VI secretion system tip protein TssI/VgrG, partial [Pseudomonadota bacterium]
GSMNASNIAANTEQFLLAIDGVDERLRVLSFACGEHISEMFTCDVSFAIKGNVELVLEDVLGKYSTLEILDAYGSHARYVNGIVGAIIQTSMDDKFTRYSLSLMPEHAVLKYRADSRIFQNKDIQAVIKEVFDDADIPSDMLQFDLSGAHKPREYCVQYNESDLAFVERLLAEEGAFYYFEHSENLHVMVIADHSTVHAQISDEAKIAYREQTGLAAEGEYISAFTHQESIGTGGVALIDYNYATPTTSLLSERNRSADQALAVFEYPGRFKDAEGASLVARHWVEGLEANKQVYSGSATVRRLVAGYYFTLKDHPKSAYDKDYLLVSVTLSGAQSGVLEEASGDAPTYCTANFKVIPLDIPFRSQNRPKKQLIFSVQTAMVVGPEGEEIYTDELGRIKVQFHWDRVGQHDANSSCWVRVAQVWAGGSWGAVFIPRIGHEVVVSFIDGDPDRPLVTGSVYHGDNTPPLSLPKDKNKSTIKSNTTKGGGGSNELRFDDTKDAEEIFIHGQKDWTIVIENDKHQSVGHDETFDIGNDRTKSVGNNQSESIGKDKSITVGDNHTESIGKNADLSVGGNMSLAVGGNLSESIGKSQNSDVAKNYSLNVGDDGNIAYGKKLTASIGKDRTLKIGDNDKISIGKDLSIMVGKKAVISVDDELTLKCGSASIILKKSGKIQIKGSDIDIKGSGNVVIKGSKIAQN